MVADTSVMERVGRALSHAEFSSCLHAQTADGERPIIIATVDDVVSSIVERVAEYGAANVVVGWENGALFILSMTLGKPAAHDRHGEESASIFESATVGLLIARMLSDGANPVRIEFVKDGHEVELTAQGETCAAA